MALSRSSTCGRSLIPPGATGLSAPPSTVDRPSRSSSNHAARPLDGTLGRRRIPDGVQPVSGSPEVHVVEPIAPGTVGPCWIGGFPDECIVEFTDDGQVQVTASNSWGLRRDRVVRVRVAEAAELGGAALRSSDQRDYFGRYLD